METKCIGEFQRIYDESVGRDAGKDKAEDKMWNRGRGKVIPLPLPVMY